MRLTQGRWTPNAAAACARGTRELICAIFMLRMRFSPKS